jgi:hypothetical protein
MNFALRNMSNNVLCKLMTYILLILSLFLTGACKNSQIDSVEREELFTLEVGHMEDQIALYSLDGTRGIRRTGFTMRDGLFYIADGNGGKISRFNSYGDLLFMIYNEDTNPPPVSLKTNISYEEQATRWAYSYPLEQPGWIAVDSRKHIFVEDRLPQQSHRFDVERNSLLDGIILHFDQDGRFINYLGCEGIGGSPFPRIVALTSTLNDELAVICRIPSGWDIYWFNSSGMLLYLVKISTSSVPGLPNWPQALSVIDSVTASPDSRRLFLKADYSRDTFDQSTNTRTGSEPVSSAIWTLNVEDGSYSGMTEIPLFEIPQNGNSKTQVFYIMLGASRNGKALLYFPVDTGYSLLYIDTNSNEQLRRNINFSGDEIRYNDFFLSSEGILSAMLADSYNIKFVWWRTDRLTGEAH